MGCHYPFICKLHPDSVYSHVLSTQRFFLAHLRLNSSQGLALLKVAPGPND